MLGKNVEMKVLLKIMRELHPLLHLLFRNWKISGLTNAEGDEIYEETHFLVDRFVFTDVRYNSSSNRTTSDGWKSCIDL